MSRQLLVFDVAGTLYGIETSSMKEIVPAQSTTRLPGAPEHVRGLLNLRGTLVTVVDLSLRLGGQGSLAEEPSILIVHADERLLGVLVDDVHEVQSTDEEGTAPPLGEEGNGMIREMGHFDGRVVFLIDVQELVRQTLA